MSYRSCEDLNISGRPEALSLVVAKAEVGVSKANDYCRKIASGRSSCDAGPTSSIPEMRGSWDLAPVRLI